MKKGRVFVEQTRISIQQKTTNNKQQTNKTKHNQKKKTQLKKPMYGWDVELCSLLDTF